MSRVPRLVIPGITYSTQQTQQPQAPPPPRPASASAPSAAVASMSWGVPRLVLNFSSAVDVQAASQQQVSARQPEEVNAQIESSNEPKEVAIQKPTCGLGRARWTFGVAKPTMKHSQRQVFEAVRNDWMNNRTESWMALHVPYTGLVEALSVTPFPIFIASSKAGHRVSALSAALLGWDLPLDSPRLCASLLPPEEKKAEALRTISHQPLCNASPHTRLHFVDDRLDTLLAVRQVPELASRWNLYLADWGYNTAEERAAAAREPGIRLLGLSDFTALLAPPREAAVEPAVLRCGDQKDPWCL
ncbi:hypothetical protein VOLCADRAFT_93606 [Volvox carteri f. nagariensis]|uniref:Uncharacterized protein n=1 Tax=Volvox carteri f. nagariensis TaxID=3068 RepID=D8U2J9_VOLCA|nr:uncharacterized protein VOLCADRAFT_93606 [Volvox carteri f. nagariensis]EFJ46071.1 hypothetical protein VOLCADRAFT_93606 [Volvox carteri f. nagariensis]|eukprot:XP_002952821.1 hypothetical protein VOLCADRAFT_93606 [Volvox carteri f. nagariensis]